MIPIRTNGLLKSNCKNFRHFPETDLSINLVSKVFEAITLIRKFNKYYYRPHGIELITRTLPEDDLLMELFALHHLPLLPVHQGVDVHPVHQLRHQALYHHTNWICTYMYNLYVAETWMNASFLSSFGLGAKNMGNREVQYSSSNSQFFYIQHRQI